MLKIEKYVYDTFTENIYSILQPNASGTMLQTCINMFCITHVPVQVKIYCSDTTKKITERM